MEQSTGVVYLGVREPGHQEVGIFVELLPQNSPKNCQYFPDKNFI